MHTPRTHQDAAAPRAVFFDLDGTLLPIDTRAFMRSYFASVRAFFERRGLSGDLVIEGVGEATRAMFSYDGATTNAERFWATFLPFMERHPEAGERTDWRALFDEFYDAEFPLLGRGVEADPLAAAVVGELRGKGYRLALTTNPLFPPQATACRLSWTGVDPAAFERVTAYQNSLYAKPSVAYYEENLRALGIAGPEVLMVGNDPVEDGAACELGCGLYLVTDHLVDRTGEGAPLDATPHGTMADLLEYVRALPALDA